MQSNKGIRAILRIGAIYELFQRLCGRDRAVREILRQHPIPSGSRVLDLGCGTGFLIPFITENISYTGIDLEPNYIEIAKTTYPQHEFILGSCSDTNQLINNNLQFDYVIVFGLFHHTNDEIFIQSLISVKQKIKEGGRIIIFEPAFLKNQSTLSKWIMKRDRGQCIREQARWVELFSSVFPDATSEIKNLYRIPYNHILLTNS